ncbi:MAG: hypothetical protein RL033_7945 [Pseudomonadota bacterium]
MITTPVPTVALLAAARAMTEAEPPSDLGLHRAVRESMLPPQGMPASSFPADFSAESFSAESFSAESLAPEATFSAGLFSVDSEPPPSSERRAAPLWRQEGQRQEGQRQEGQRQDERRLEGRLLASAPFEFEPAPRSVRNSQAAPPLAEELGLDHLLADFNPRRSWSLWLRSYGVWIVAALLVLWLVVTFAASWLPL